MYGVEVGGVPWSSLRQLSQATLSATWGMNRQLRAKELVFTLCAKGHLIDPCQAVGYRCLTLLRKMLSRRRDLHPLFESLWAVSRNRNGLRAGPLGLCFEVLDELGWLWLEPYVFTRPHKSPLHLVEGPNSWYQHEIREGLRCVEWNKVGERRRDCEGLAGAVVDRTATCALWKSKKNTLSARPPARSRHGLAAAPGLLQAGLKDTPLCQFCRQADETVSHCIHDCPCWAFLRLGAPSADVRATWPVCTRSLGVFLEDPRVVELQSNFVGAEDVALDQVCEYTGVGGEVSVWTDGASRNNADDRFRRAGAGIHYAENCPHNRALALPGKVQTNQRAELYAVVKVLEQDPRCLDIRSDSQYVCDGFGAIQSGGVACLAGDNQDLWSRLLALLVDRRAPCRMTKVLGHASWDDVGKGITDESDKVGNDGADALAVAAAMTHLAPGELTAAAARRRRDAADTQLMTLRILEQRLAAESTIAGADVAAEAAGFVTAYDGLDGMASVPVDADPG